MNKDQTKLKLLVNLLLVNVARNRPSTEKCFCMNLNIVIWIMPSGHSWQNKNVSCAPTMTNKKSEKRGLSRNPHHQSCIRNPIFLIRLIFWNSIVLCRYNHFIYHSICKLHDSVFNRLRSPPKAQHRLIKIIYKNVALILL